MVYFYGSFARFRIQVAKLFLVFIRALISEIIFYVLIGNSYHYFQQQTTNKGP